MSVQSWRERTAGREVGRQFSFSTEFLSENISRKSKELEKIEGIPREEYIAKLVALLAEERNEITSVEELAEASISKIQGLSAGKESFLTKAIREAVRVCEAILFPLAGLQQ